MNKPKVVVTRKQFDSEMDRLRAVSDLTIIESDHLPTQEELKSKVIGAKALFVHINDDINGEIMDAAGDSLKIIGQFGVGYDNVDVDAASERNIAVANTPGVLTETTASFAFTLMQAAARRIAECDRFVRDGKWKYFEPLDLLGYDLSASVLGIIGYGNTGRAFAKCLSGFNCKVLAYDKNKKNFSDDYVQESSLEDIQNKSDIISFHTPYDESTHHYLNEAFIKKMNKPFYVINTARGKVINTSDFIKGLKSKKIQGACLDVLEYEKATIENTFSEKIDADFLLYVELDHQNHLGRNQLLHWIKIF